MPFLLRIILQRVLIFIYSTLAFLGISPDVDIPTEHEANVAIEERREKISEVFNKIIKTESESRDEITPQVEERVTDIPTPKNIPSFIELANQIETVVKNVPEIISSRNIIDDVLFSIICERKNGNMTIVSYGSGVLISPSGAILTVAHVAQFMLLEDNNSAVGMNCTLYRENIPTYGYKADVVYLPPQWIKDNHHLINESNPRGDGKKDYAILHITNNTNPTISLPSTFTYSPFSIKESNLTTDKKISVAGYPGSQRAKRNLIIDTTYIDDIGGFDRNSVDIISTGETKVAAQGSSGGGIFLNDSKDLIGLIVATEGSLNNKIRATTLSYINNDLIKDTGKGLTYYTSGNLSAKSTNFRDNWGTSLTRLIEGEY